MKYRILVVALILLMLFNVNVNAAYEYSLSLPDGYTSVTLGEDLSAVSKKLNMTNDELSSYFHQTGLEYLAVSSDNKTQIKLSAFTDNFSSSAGDISNLDETAINEFISAISSDSQSTATIVLNNDRKFICIKNTRQDSGGVYTVTQYITICDSKTFYFAGYNEGEETSSDIDLAFNSLKLQKQTSETPNYTLPLIFVIIGVVVFVTLAVVMLIGIIKHYKTKETEVKEDAN